MQASAEVLDTLAATGTRVRKTIRTVMALKRISGPRLAQALGWSTPTLVYDRLNGKTAIAVEELAAIAEVLDEPVSTFFDGGLKIRCYSDTPVLEAIEGEGPLTLFPERSGRALELVDN